MFVSQDLEPFLGSRHCGSLEQVRKDLSEMIFLCRDFFSCFLQEFFRLWKINLLLVVRCF